jgi:hypothetical protein
LVIDVDQSCRLRRVTRVDDVLACLVGHRSFHSCHDRRTCRARRCCRRGTHGGEMLLGHMASGLAVFTSKAEHIR